MNFLEKKKKLMFYTPDTVFTELRALADQSHDSGSLPVLIVEGDEKHKRQKRGR